MIASTLRASGKRVGVYNSPHLVHWSEAVLINGAPDIDGWRGSMDAIQAALGHVEGVRGRYTAFEASCAAMWLQLARAHVDYAVVEAGVGGMRDATNVCDSVSAAALTTVGLDHQDLLGSTIAEIAHDKCGIFKPGCPAVVSALLHQEALPVVTSAAQRLQCPLTLAPAAEPVRGSGGGEGEFVWADGTGAGAGEGGAAGGGLRFSLGLLGSWQGANSGVALAVIRALQRSDASINDAHITQGMARARWPGRMEQAAWGGQDLLLDGAHNHEAARALGAHVDDARRRAVRRWREAGLGGAGADVRVRWIVGMSAGKDVEGVVRALVRAGDEIECVGVESLPRRHQAAPPSRIRAAAEAAGVSRATEHECLADALGRACQEGDGVVLRVLCGSLHLVADFRQLPADRNL